MAADMSFFKLLAVSTVLAFSSLAQASNFVRGAYIMEFADSTTTADIDAFYSSLASIGIKATPRLRLEHEIFKGCSFQIESDNELDAIALINGLDSVGSVWPMKSFARPDETIRSILKGSDPTGVVAKRQESEMSSTAALDNNSPHRMGGVDKLHAEGYTGKGLFIGVIDTGVDYLHPALGGCFGPKCKVVAGYDLVGDDYNGYTTPVPDDDPMDVSGHGTHVSGIIAAGPNEQNFTGVVPDATLGMWRIFGRRGSSSEDIIIDALMMAFEAGVDIISLSLGSGGGWTEGADNAVVDRIAAHGTPVIYAQGNNGTDGLFMAGSAADAIGATAVGSVDNTDTPSLLTIATYSIGSNSSAGGNGSETNFGYSQLEEGDFGTVSLPLYPASLDINKTDDGCAPFPAGTPDLASYVVLIKRGTCTFQTKLNNAVAAGATRVLLYNNVSPGAFNPSYTYDGVPMAMVSRSQGEIWIAALQAGNKVTINFVENASAKQELIITKNNITGGYMSSFSSWGPTYEAWLKPEISGPGGQILSTIPNNMYGVLTGTSMATPYISGVVALIKQIRGKQTLTPLQISSLLSTTGQPLDYNDATQAFDFIAPVAQQGGGLVDAYKAAHTTTLVDVDNIALNDTQFFVPAHPLTFTNLCVSEQTYTFSHLVSATAYTFASGNTTPSIFPQELEVDTAASAAVVISFQPASLTIPGKSSGQVVVHFTAPSGLDEQRVPIFSGYVAVNGSQGDALTVPYAGIAANLTTVPQMDAQNGYPYVAASSQPVLQYEPEIQPMLPNNTALPPAHVFVLPRPAFNATTYVANSSTVYPTATWRLAMGTRLLRIDVVPVSGNATSSYAPAAPEILGEPALAVQFMSGDIYRNSFESLSRGSEDYAQWNGVLADGSVAPAGTYKFLFRSLKIFGDQALASAYERHETVEFEIRYT
ncbi:subtilase [Phlyctema vagabunda]|uniref:Subtilase n=1 Tax=Phlyctema vagabunda TaxID=108571 RepID=A0ABR4P2P1_9HELO